MAVSSRSVADVCSLLTLACYQIHCVRFATVLDAAKLRRRRKGTHFGMVTKRYGWIVSSLPEGRRQQDISHWYPLLPLFLSPATCPAPSFMLTCVYIVLNLATLECSREVLAPLLCVLPRRQGLCLGNVGRYWLQPDSCGSEAAVWSLEQRKRRHHVYHSKAVVMALLGREPEQQLHCWKLAATRTPLVCEIDA